MKDHALKWISENEAAIVEVSDRIWGFAEVGLQEFRSSGLLADELEKHGFTVTRGAAGMPTAFTASWGEGNPVIGVMGEFDALPGLSQKPIPQKEALVEGAPGHGCGHNIHGTSGMAGAVAARYAMEAKNIKGTVRFFGCPAEETLVGKVFMVRDGVFKGVDAIISHHPGSMNTTRLGSTNALDSIKFHFHGIASHAGSTPDQGRSALDAAELMNVGVNYLREHVIQETRIHYVIEDGGHEPNVVPPYARSWYYVRAPERRQVESTTKWIYRIADGADLMANTKHDIEYLTGCYNTLPNRVLGEVVTKNMREIGAPEYGKEELRFAEEISKSIPKEQKRNVLQRSKRPGWEKLLDIDMDTSIPDPWDEGMVWTWSTDVGDVSWQAPAMEFLTSTFALGTPGHSWQNVVFSKSSIGHKSLLFAARTIACSALDLMTKPELVKRAQQEFAERTRGTPYKSALPPDLNPPLDQLPSDKDH